MANAASTDKRFRHAFHANCRLQSSGHADVFQSILQCQAVDHRRQHAHVVSGGRVNGRANCGKLLPAQNVSAATNNRQLYARVDNLLDLLGNVCHFRHADPGLAAATKAFATDL